MSLKDQDKAKKSRVDLLPPIFIAVAAVLALIEIHPPTLSDDPVLDGMLRGIITRALGSAIFALLAVRLGRHILGVPSWRALILLLPAFLVVINNFPIIGLISGTAGLDSPPHYILIYALSSILVGLFEELAFRGVFYMLLLEPRRDTSRSVFWVSALSSALFGAIHLVNLFAGAGVGTTILQVGYSFLIGGMCSIALLVSGSIWVPVVLHALFDFGGYLVPTLGYGVVWDTATVILTAVLGVAVTIHMILLLIHRGKDCADRLFAEK